MRKERDALGEMDVPDEVYYGIQTCRVADNYNISDHTYGEYPEIITAMAEVKKACAITNAQIGALAKDKSVAIVQACDEMIAGKFTDQFPVNVWRSQGTGVNMNVNEILANRANEILTGNRGYDAVHPNSHVNMCQSSNDVFPTCEAIVLYRKTAEVVQAAHDFEKVLAAKALSFKDTVRLGRTGMQDAVPMTWGQIFGGWHSMMQRNRQALDNYRHVFQSTVLGATILGTGMGQQPGYLEHIYENLSKVVGFELHWAEMDGEVIADSAIFDGMRNTDHQFMLMAHLKALMSGASRIANDLILFGSGPRCGLRELRLPALNTSTQVYEGEDAPYVAEAMLDVLHQITAAEQMAFYSANEGQQDHGSLNSGGITGVVDSLTLAKGALEKFTPFVSAVEVNSDVCLKNAALSTSLSTMVSALFGYPIGVKCAKLALAEGISCKEAALKENLLPPEVAEELFDVRKLTDRKATVAMFKKYGKLRKIS